MRIVHNNDSLIIEVENDNVRIATPHIIFDGTIDECETEIELKNLFIKDEKHYRIKHFKPRIKKEKAKE